jgi:hypothetical protein
MNNFQIQMAHHQNVLPITRNYIGEEEERLRTHRFAPARASSRSPRSRALPSDTGPSVDSGDSIHDTSLPERYSVN